MNIREETKELHDNVEKTVFAQRLLSGDFTEQDYLNYLRAQYFIFNILEIGPITTLPHHSLFRCEKIFNDIAYLKSVPDSFLTPKSALEYTHHIQSILEDEKAKNSHIYLNYLGMMFGGSIVAKQIPTEGNMYKFENRSECIKAIRELELDVEEVKRGFEYQIRIMEELEEMRK